MLGLDGIAQERWWREEAKQAQLENRRRALAQDIESNSLSVANDEGRDVSNLLAQMGRPLGAWDVMRKLKKCNASLHFEYSKSDHSKIGIYIPTRQALPTGGTDVILKFICGMESGIMPEFSVLHKTKKQVPDQDLLGSKKPTREVNWKEIETFSDETRGWRTVLVRLLHAKLITEADVRKHFGWTPSRDSRKWYDQTR